MISQSALNEAVAGTSELFTEFSQHIKVRHTIDFPGKAR